MYKIKLPLRYYLLITILVIIAVLLYLLTFGGRTVEDIISDTFLWLFGAIVAYAFLIILALIGAFFLGMFLSHRILSIGGFTPFEEEMLKMGEEIKAINQKLESLTDIEKDTNSKEDTAEEMKKD